MGVNTVVAQIVAESFGIPVDYVKVVSGDTAVCPYGWPPVGSHTTFYLGNALLIACEDAKRQLFEIVAPRLGVRAELLEIRDRKVYVKGHPGKELEIRELFRPIGQGIPPTKPEIIGQGSFHIPGIPEDPETGGQYPGWPKTVDMKDNYGRRAVACLPTLMVSGMVNPVVQVIHEASSEIVFTLRIKGTVFRPKVFEDGMYTVKIGEPDIDRMKVLHGLQSLPLDKEQTIDVIF